MKKVQFIKPENEVIEKLNIGKVNRANLTFKTFSGGSLIEFYKFRDHAIDVSVSKQCFNLKKEQMEYLVKWLGYSSVLFKGKFNKC